MNELRDVFTKYKAVVFFDTETTGLEAESCQIIELAAIRVEKTERGTLRMADSADMFVKLPEDERIPQKIVELTGITDERLENEGITEAEAAARFAELISGGPVLLVAHNAQFDLLFTAEMLRRHGNGGPEALKAADYLDSLTVYKDRRAYPHKLANAILTYKLEDKVQNSHRAIDDVAALFEVCKAMDAERSDLLSYVNVFGYNPKYGVSGKRIEKVAYWPQNFNKYMQLRAIRSQPNSDKEGGNRNAKQLAESIQPGGIHRVQRKKKRPPVGTGKPHRQSKNHAKA